MQGKPSAAFSVRDDACLQTQTLHINLHDMQAIARMFIFRMAPIHWTVHIYFLSTCWYQSWSLPSKRLWPPNGSRCLFLLMRWQHCLVPMEKGSKLSFCLKETQRSQGESRWISLICQSSKENWVIKVFAWMDDSRKCKLISGLFQSRLPILHWRYLHRYVSRCVHLD